MDSSRFVSCRDEHTGISNSPDLDPKIQFLLNILIQNGNTVLSDNKFKGISIKPGYGGPQVDPAVVAWFQSVDVDRSGQISALELQQALTNNDWSRFQIGTCYQMIALFDRDYSGTINIQEFNSLWGYINQWRTVFSAYDQDRSGAINEQELHTAFSRMGFNVTPNFVRTAIWRYDVTGRRQLSFEDFINCSLIMQSLTGTFKQRDTQMRGTAQIGYEDFMSLAVASVKP